jgi:hypothetical protein
MIGRSLGRSISKKWRKQRIIEFKKCVFNELDRLCRKMDNDTLTTRQIRNSIKRIDKIPNVSYGQAQKAINVILKYHYIIYHFGETVGSRLDCPLDSFILKLLEENNIPLLKMNYNCYCRIQKKIQNPRIDFDDNWDKAHLKRHQLL